MEKNKPQVVIVYKGSNTKSVGMLAWDGGSGPARVYDKDNYDSRLDLGRKEIISYVGTVKEFFDMLLLPDGLPEDIQLDLTVANRFGLVD